MWWTRGEAERREARACSLPPPPSNRMVSIAVGNRGCAMTSTIQQALLSTQTSISSLHPGLAMTPSPLQITLTSSTSPTHGEQAGTTPPPTTLASVHAEPALLLSPSPSHSPHTPPLSSPTSTSPASSANANLHNSQNTSSSLADLSVHSATCAAPLLPTVQIPPLHHPLPPPPPPTTTTPPPLSLSTPPFLSESSPSPTQTTRNLPLLSLPPCPQKINVYPPSRFLTVLLHIYLMQTPPCPASLSSQTHPLPVLASLILLP